MKLGRILERRELEEATERAIDYSRDRELSKTVRLSWLRVAKMLLKQAGRIRDEEMSAVRRTTRQHKLDGLRLRRRCLGVR